MTTPNPYAPFADAAEKDHFDRIVENERRMLRGEAERCQHIDRSRWSPVSYLRDASYDA